MTSLWSKTIGVNKSTGKTTILMTINLVCEISAVAKDKWNDECQDCQVQLDQIRLISRKNEPNSFNKYQTSQNRPKKF